MSDEKHDLRFRVPSGIARGDELLVDAQPKGALLVQVALCTPEGEMQWNAIHVPRRVVRRLVELARRTR